MHNLTMDNPTQTEELPPDTASANESEPAASARPRSEAQINASRLNGAKSRGPVTEEGKLASSQNARRHGALSKFAVLEGESSKGFLGLSAELQSALIPSDEVERCLVDTMILAMWRRLRVLGMETAGIHALGRRHVPNARPGEASDIYPLTFAGLAAHPAERQVLDLFHRYEARHARTFERALRSLAAYRAFRKTDPAPAPQPETENVPNEPGPAAQPGQEAPVQETPVQESQPETPKVPRREAKKLPNEPKPGTPEPPAPHAARHKKLNRKQRRQLKFGQQRTPGPNSGPHHDNRGASFSQPISDAPQKAAPLPATPLAKTPDSKNIDR